MKPSTTVILLALTAGLAGWLLWRREGGPEHPGGHFLFDWSGNVAQKERVAVDVNAAEVAGIDLKSNAATISLRKRDDGGWEITNGVKDRADESIVKELLDYCSTARIADVIDREELEDGKLTATSLGLDDANAWRVSWLRADGSTLADIRAGLTAPLNHAGYVQVSGQDSRPDIYIVSPDLRPLFARPLDSFRDPRVSRFSSEEVVRMVVRNGEGEVEFSRASATAGGDPGPWVISRPLPNAPANQPAVMDFVAMICGARIKEWIAYNEGTRTGDGDEKPVVEVTLFPEGANSKGATLSFFNDPDAPEKTAVCRDIQRKARFKVDKQIMEDLRLAERPDVFRSRKLASVEPGIISTIKVTAASGDSVLVVRVRDKWSWRPLAGGPWNDAAPERVEKLITLLNDTEILDFSSNSLTDPSAFGLDQPAITVTMAAGAHISLDQLTPVTGKNSQTLRIGIRNDGIFANFAGDPFVYKTGPELPEGIPQSYLKWRSLALPGFSTRQIRSLKQTVGTAPPLQLVYDARTFKWAASRAGEDLTHRLNTGAVEEMATRLGGLSVAAWLENAAAAAKALETPSLSMQIEIEAFDDAPSASRFSTMTLELAPIPGSTATGAPLCYGRLSGIPELFLIESQLMRLLSTEPLQK